MNKKILSILLTFVMILSGCGGQTNAPVTGSVLDTPDSSNEQTAVPEEPTATPDPVTAKIASMTLEEKVAQLFIVTPEAITDVTTVIAAGEKTKEALENYPVGGLVYFAKNIKDPEQLTKMMTNVSSYGESVEGMPLFLSIDEEGGSVARIAKNKNFDVTRYTSMRSIGDSGNTSAATKAGKTIGSYLKKYGFNLDFAPDADVITNPENKVIGNRSFGTDAALVSDMVTAAIDGFEDAGVLSCIKHFPGHGCTEGDTHEGFAYTKKTWSELKKEELKPFEASIEKNVPFIMVSHISVPTILGDNTPSTLSKKMVTTYLRKELGYNGIIITDAMDMGAIVNNYDSEKAVIKAFKAGVDIILMPKNFKKAYKAMLDAVKDGEITESRIDESLQRIIQVKLTNLQK